MILDAIRHLTHWYGPPRFDAHTRYVNGKRATLAGDASLPLLTESAICFRRGTRRRGWWATGLNPGRNLDKFSQSRCTMVLWIEGSGPAGADSVGGASDPRGPPSQRPRATWPRTTPACSAACNQESWLDRIRSLGPLYSTNTTSPSVSPRQATTSGRPPLEESAAALIPRYASRTGGGSASGATIQAVHCAGAEPN